MDGSGLPPPGALSEFDHRRVTTRAAPATTGPVARGRPDRPPFRNEEVGRFWRIVGDHACRATRRPGPASPELVSFETGAGLKHLSHSPATSSDQLATTELIGLTAGKTVANSSHRWIPFFIPELARGLSTSTATLTTVVGIGEMAGLVTLFLGRWLDAGHERRLMRTALWILALAGLLAAAGSVPAFAVAVLLFLLGVSVYTVGGHTYISGRARFERRARALGVFETSWALGLLIGAPSAALLISTMSWRAPFLVSAILAAMAAVIFGRLPEAIPSNPASSSASRLPLTNRARLTVASSAAVSFAGLSTIVVSGTWMERELGISTGGVGLIAMAFGVAELSSSSLSATIADGVGVVRATMASLTVLVAGVAVMATAGSSVVIGSLGLAAFFLGFEFSIVTSFSIVSEAMPSARGRVLAINGGVGTMARSGGAISSGLVYDAVGIGGTAALSASAAALAIGLLAATTRA